MGAVFAAAARAPLTSLASVIELTGDFTLALPVMLAVAIAIAVSRALSYGTIYTAKLLRRGTDIDRSAPAHPLADLTVADAMRPFQEPLATAPQPQTAGGQRGRGPASLPGPVTSQPAPQALPASDSLTQALRQLMADGRDGLPVLSADGQHLQGWITSQSALRAMARRLGISQTRAAQAETAAQQDVPGTGPALLDSADPQLGFQVLEITLGSESPAIGQKLGQAPWPPGSVPVSVLRNRTLRDPEPGLTLSPGDRVSLLSPPPPHA